MSDRQIAIALGRHDNFVSHLRNNNKPKYKDIFKRCNDPIESARMYSNEVQSIKMVILDLASNYPYIYKDFVKTVYKSKCFRHNLTMDNFLIIPEEDNIFATYKTVLRAKKIIDLYREFTEFHNNLLKDLK